MIRFRVLGPLELKGSGGEDILSVLSQPKRIGLLAYLALSTTQGFQRRDTLLGLFWPELDQERARGALRKAIYFLRKSLGEEIFSTRADEELAINWSRLTCDAVEFEESLGAGKLELALELYRGDLLEGVFVSECPEFEKWLDEQREKLRESAAGAAWSLAHRYLELGRITDGERMGQRALSLAPTDEHEVRRFIEALNGAGDRAGAVHFYEKFARILEDLLDLRPAAETRALVQGMRDTLGTSPPSPAAREPVGSPAGQGEETLRSHSRQERLLERIRASLSHRYTVLEELGSGGMATVFLAEDPKHGRKVALKVLEPSIADALGTDRFLHEIEIAANLNHPHILPLFDSGEADGLLYYVMPFAEGESLQSRLRREKQLPLDDAVAIAREIAQALGFAHEKGVIHRDVKPGNILLEAGHAVLTDFGIARALALAEGKKQTRPGVTVGTPAYMSPEQGLGDAELDGRSDQYALACVLYEMLAGEEPFRGPTGESVARQHLTRDPIPVQQIRPSVPDHVSSVLHRGMAKAPADRFPSMKEFARALGPLPARSTDRPRPWILRGPVLGTVLGLVVSYLILLGVLKNREPLPEAPAPGEIVLAIMPFSVQGPDSIQWMREGMVTLLGTTLDNVGGVRTVDRNRLLESVGRLEPGARLSLEEAQETARRFGATHFILGEGVGTGGGRITLATTLYPVEAGIGDEIEVRVDGPLSDPSGLVDSLLRPVLGGLQVAAGQRLSGTAALTTDSTAALRAFLKGEGDFRATRYAEAYDAFDEAVAIDETFAMAHYRKSVAAVLDLRFDQAHLAADRAWEYSSRLTPRDRRLLQAWAALIGGSAERAERLYQGILEDYPDEVEAHFGLGSVLVYFNPVRGRPVSEAEPHFRRVLQLMPSYGQARFHLLEFATVRRDQETFDSLFAGVGRESDQALAWAAVRAYGWGDSDAQERVKARVRTAAPVEAGLAVARVAAYLQAHSEAETLASLLTGPDRDPDTRCAARILTAMMRFARGRWDDGMASLGEADGCNHAWAIELQGLFTGFPLRPVVQDEVDRVRERLLAWEAGQVSLSTNFALFAHNGFHASLRLYLLALANVWSQDLDEALRYSEELRREGRSEGLRAINPAWAQSIRARIAAARGDTAEAARFLESARPDVHLELISISPFFSRSFDRFLLGQLLLALGRDEEALAWFRTLTEGHELVLVAPACLEMARILEARGDMEAARRNYGRFTEIWKDADPWFQPLVEEARAKIASLESIHQPDL